MWEIEQLKIRKKIVKIKVQNSESEAKIFTKIFNINWNFLAKHISTS